MTRITSATLLALAFSTLAAWAQQAPNWVVSCTNAANPGQLTCGASQSVVLSETGARLLTVEVVKTGNTTRLALVLPLGFLLPEGVQVAVDQSEVLAVPVRTCDALGCYSQAELEDAALDALQSGETVTVSLSNLDGTTLEFNVPLEGFAQSYGVMP